MSLLATRSAVGLLISTLGLTKTGELTADSLTVKFPNWTPPRSYSVCANQRLSRDCSFATSQHPFSTRFGIVRFQYIICDAPVSLYQGRFQAEWGRRRVILAWNVRVCYPTFRNASS